VGVAEIHQLDRFHVGRVARFFAQYCCRSIISLLYRTRTTGRFSVRDREKAVFNTLKQLPPDAIIGIMALFRADDSRDKIDLSVGVYQDESGNTPVFETVRRAEQALLDEQTTKTYVGIAGNALFNSGMEKLIFGKDHAALAERRVATVQTPGGSGALCVAAHLMHRARQSAKVYLSSPSWPNHLPLLKLAGLKLGEYPYYDTAAHRIDFEAMVAAVEHMASGEAVLLHGCCHNPCGADLSHEQWHVLAELCARRGLIPFVDFAYQGLAEGLEADAFGVRIMAEHVPELIVVSSCSKNFGLYRERVGSVSVMSPHAEQSAIVAMNLANIARGIYSMPPDHGAAIVGRILNDAELKAAWESELTAMRERINGLRQLLVSKLAERNTSIDFSFIGGERGMFSFLGLSRDQIVALREQFHVYMVESSRVNIAGVNSRNVDTIADSIAAVLAA
jgi:aspartate aminotransferase